jgi:hypothetical protein
MPHDEGPQDEAVEEQAEQDADEEARQEALDEDIRRQPGPVEGQEREDHGARL